MDMLLKSWFSYKGMPFWVEILDNWKFFLKFSKNFHKNLTTRSLKIKDVIRVQTLKQKIWYELFKTNLFNWQVYIFHPEPKFKVYA